MASWRTKIIEGTPSITVDVEGDGPAVIFLHGLGGNRSNWHDQLPYFGRFAKAIAWDARGYGDSGDYSGPYRFADVCDDLIRVLDYFSAASAHLIGLSMGGRVALEFSKRHPDRLATVTFAATSARPGEPLAPVERDQALQLRRQPFEDGRGVRGMAENMLANLVGPNATPNMKQRIMDSLMTVHPECYLKSVETVIRYADFPPYSSIQVPCLVITGTADRLATPDYAQKIAEQIPDASLVILEDVGHLCNIESPQAFNAAVADFLASRLKPIS